MKKILSLILAIAMIISILPVVSAEDTGVVSYTYAFTNGSWLERGNTSTQARTLKNNAFKTEALTDAEWAYLGSGTSKFIGRAGTNLYNMVVGNFNSAATRVIAENAGEWIAFKVEVPTTGKYTVDVKSYL